MRKIPTLFKYRSLTGDSFKYTQDIFINKRLYLPLAKELNDPNEGIAEIQIENMYKGWGNQIEERNRLSTRIFSLTETNRSALMWSHYADNQKGICIKFDFKRFLIDENATIGKVKYLKTPAKISHQNMSNYSEIFLNKENSWRYEKEWRIISQNKVSYIPLDEQSIKSIYLGPRFDKSNLDWVSFWASSFNPKSPIPLITMGYASSEYELLEEHELNNKINRLSL